MNRYPYRNRSQTLAWSLLTLVLALLIGLFFWEGGVSMLTVGKGTTEIEIPGLLEPVTISEDQNHFPMIEAKNDHDLFFMQGYIGFSNRPVQTLRQRAMLAGELAKIFGEDYLPSDIHFRTLGLARLAKEQVAVFDDETRAIFTAYQEGLNASLLRLATESKQDHYQSFELKPWTLEDVAINLYLPALFSADNMPTEILNQRLINQLGFDEARHFFPYNKNPLREIPSFDYGDLPKSEGFVGHLPLDNVKFLLSGLTSSSPQLTTASGSNNWALMADKSSSGGALLSNDPHVDIRELPNVYLGFGLATPAGRAVGVTIAGLPGLMIGRNENVAFGLTLSFIDNQDLYVEDLNPENPNEYRNGDAWVPFKTYEEVIEVAGALGVLHQEKLVLRESERGIVIHEGVIGEERQPQALVLNWTVQGAFPRSLGIADWLFSTDISEAKKALLTMENWHFNYLLADTAGKIEHVLTGRIPRRNEASAGLYPRQARSFDPDLGFLMEEEKPTLSSDKGYLATNNQALDISLADGQAPVGSGYSPSYRFTRILDLLETATKDGGKVMTDASWSWLADTYDPSVSVWLPVFVAGLEKLGGEYTAMADVLRTYDGMSRQDDASAFIFSNLWKSFVQETYRSALGEELAYYYLRESGTWVDRLEDALTSGDESLWQAGGGLAKTVEKALTQTHSLFPNMVNEDWGAYHFVRFNLGKDSVFLPMSGTSFTLALASYDIRLAKFEAKTLQSLKMLADLSQKDTLTLIIPGGIREDVKLSFRPSQIEQWYKNEPIYVGLSPRLVAQQAVHVWQALPESSN